MPKQKISVTVSDKQAPVVSFPNGQLVEKRKRKMTVSALHDASQRGSGKRRKTVVAQTKRWTYSGRNFGPLSHPDEATELYLAEVNRTTGHMTLFPSEVIHLRPQTKADTQSQPVDLESMSFTEKNDLLTGAFGMRKQKKAMRQRQNNRAVEQSATSVMESALEQARTAQSSEPEPQQQETSSAIPPYNKDATTPRDVYSLLDIVGPAERDSLTQVSQVLKNCTADSIRAWAERKEYPCSVLSRLRRMPVEEGARGERACLLMYLHYMVSMFHLKYDQIRKSEPLPRNWPDMVKGMMLERFTVKVAGQRRCVPARVKDLLVSHILVLCLIVDNFSTSLNELVTDLKISLNRLQNHARALGCRVKNQTTNDATGAKVVMSEAVLTVPLTFPPPPKPKKSRG